MASTVTNLEHLPLYPMAWLFFGMMLLIVWSLSAKNPTARKIMRVSGILGVVGLVGWVLALTTLRSSGDISETGGVTFVLAVQGRLDDNGKSLPVDASNIDQTRHILEKRLDAASIQDFKVVAKGGEVLEVVLPGFDRTRVPEIQNLLLAPAVLELREVCPRNDEAEVGGKPLAERVAEGSELVPGYKAYQHAWKGGDGTEHSQAILLNRRAAITGADISRAIPSPQQADALLVTLNSTGTDKMIALTQNMRPGLARIAIVLDGKVISAPVLNQVPLGKNFIIEGLRAPGEVQTLANSLMCPLESPLLLKEVRTVSPKLIAK